MPDFHAKTSLYHGSLGKSLTTLPEPIIRRLHEAPSATAFKGRTSVKNGNFLAQLLGRLASFIKAQGEMPLTVTIARTAEGEQWKRWFGGLTMTSNLRFEGKRLLERHGLFDLVFELTVVQATVVWRLVSVSAFWFAFA